MLFFHALHWSVGEHPEAMVVEILRRVLPDSGQAQMEVALAKTPEQATWVPHDSTVDAIPRRLTEDTAAISSMIGWWGSSLIVMVVLTYVFASRYKSSITDRRVPWQGCPPGAGLQPTGGIWKYETCKCLDDCDYCLYGFYCAPCRFADTYTMTSIGPSYAVYIHAFVIVQVIGQIVQLVVAYLGASLGTNFGDTGRLGFQVVGAVKAYWLAGQRAKLRQALGDPAPDTHCVMDFVLYWWCGCCTAIQEGKQVDEITNTQTKCFLQLQPIQMAPPGIPAVVVGRPVGAPAAPVVGTVVADPQQQVGGVNYGNVATGASATI